MSEIFGVARPGLFARRSEAEVLDAYRRTYGLGSEITISHVVDHASLESLLTSRLVGSSKVNRAETFRTAYTSLYAQLPWLNTTSETRNFDDWLGVLKPNSRILEIGSGAGNLIAFLAGRGFTCFATEVSDKRGKEVARGGAAGVVWRNTDGVNLTDFEKEGSFDHVISDQVIEHLHPDDIETHLGTARDLLVPGGSYVLRTPHRSAGPHDLSRVFGFDSPCFMHLHEYTFGEIRALARRTGYMRVEAIVPVPVVGRRKRWVISAGALLRYNEIIETLEKNMLRTQINRRRFRRISKPLLIPTSIWVRLVR